MHEKSLGQLSTIDVHACPFRMHNSTMHGTLGDLRSCTNLRGMSVNMDAPVDSMSLNTSLDASIAQLPPNVESLVIGIELGCTLWEALLAEFARFCKPALSLLSQVDVVVHHRMTANLYTSGRLELLFGQSGVVTEFHIR